MLVDRRDESSAGSEKADGGTAGGERWREVVRLLEANARARTRLEAVETALLREAYACDVAARLGYVSLEEFVERHLGYGRHAANERCRVSLELEALPRLRAAYADGTLAFSHVRELTRVATPQTEGAYLAAAAGKTTRQVQQLVSGKRAGDAPEAPPDPALVTHTLVLELGGEAFAMWRRAQQVLEDEVGERLSSDELVMQLCSQTFAPVGRAGHPEQGAPGVADRAVRSRGTAARTADAAELDPDRSRGTTTTPTGAEQGSVPSRGTTTGTTEAEQGPVQSRGTTTPTEAALDAGRSRGTTATTTGAEPGSARSRGTTAATGAGAQRAGDAGPAATSTPTRARGHRIAPPPTLHAVTTCRSCQRATASGVGSAEPLTPAQRDRALCDAIHVGDLDTSERTRPSLTVPSAIRRKVAIASNHACVVPGCRSRRHLTIHHLRYQAHGGGHTVENCVLACHAHHQRLHEGRLRIEGTAPHALDIAWRHPATNAEQDAGAGPWVWRRVPPDPTDGRRDR